MAKHFMIFYPNANQNNDAFLQNLGQNFGKSNVYPLKGRDAFVVKVQDNSGFQDVMDKVGFNENKKETGVLIEFDNSNINGWYSQALWSFIGQG